MSEAKKMCTITDMIESLQEVLAAHGDIRVCVLSPDKFCGIRRLDVMEVAEPKELLYCISISYPGWNN